MNFPDYKYFFLFRKKMQGFVMFNRILYKIKNKQCMEGDKFMKKIMALGAAGVLSLAMGTSVFAADSLGRFACSMIGHHMGFFNAAVYEGDYSENYALTGEVRQSVENCVIGYPGGCALADQVCQNSGVCVQGCPGGYVDANGNGICDNCEAVGYHGSCDYFVDADGNGVCDNLHNGNYCGNVNGNGGGYGARNGSSSGSYGNSSGSGNGGSSGVSNSGSSSGGGYGNGYGGGNGGHHGGGHGRECRR